MASEYQIISDILGNNYKEDLQTSPWLQASQAMGQMPAIQPGQKWYEALAQGLAFGGVQGGLRGAGLELARQEKQQNAQDTLGFLGALQSGDTAKMAELEKKSRFMPELSSQLKLAQAVENVTNSVSGKNVSQAMADGMASSIEWMDEADKANLKAQLVGQPLAWAQQMVGMIRANHNMDPEVRRDQAAATAGGRLSGTEDFSVQSGVITPKADEALKQILPSIKTNDLYKNYNKLSTYTAQVRKFVEQDHPLADYAAIVSFVKGIDPATAAREGEVEAATSARSMINNILGKIQKQGNASTLTAADKKALLTAMDTLEKTTGRGLYEKVIYPEIGNLITRGGIDAFSAFNFAVPKEYQDYHNSFVNSGLKALDLMQRGDKEGLIGLRGEVLDRARTLPSLSGFGGGGATVTGNPDERASVTVLGKQYVATKAQIAAIRGKARTQQEAQAMLEQLTNGR